MTPAAVLAALARARLVPVVTLDEAADAGPLAEALVTGGLPAHPGSAARSRPAGRRRCAG